MGIHLKRFLQDYQGKEVWFLIPPGLVNGVLGYRSGDSDEKINLTPASYITGSRVMQLMSVSFTESEVYSWGPGILVS